jgi:hypothetical protein
MIGDQQKAPSVLDPILTALISAEVKADSRGSCQFLSSLFAAPSAFAITRMSTRCSVAAEKRSEKGLTIYPSLARSVAKGEYRLAACVEVVNGPHRCRREVQYRAHTSVV